MGKMTVLGINGRIGQEVAKAFVAAGWSVTGMGRTDKAHLAGVTFIAGDAASVADLKHATADADVVFNALNLPYDKWDKGRAEAQLANVLTALKGSGKTLMFPGNIYNFAADQIVLTPGTPFRPAREKGEIRVRMEQQLEAASRDGLQVIILRLADFFAPSGYQTNFDLAMMARIKSNVLQYPGRLDLGHSWAYLPDVGRAAVKLADNRRSLGRFERFHYPGHHATGHQMVAAIQKALPRPAKVTLVPWGMLKMIGLFVPIIREVIKMNYLWSVPHRLEDKRLSEILGPDFDTPFEEAVMRTTRSYLPAGEGAQNGKIVTA